MWWTFSLHRLQRRTYIANKIMPRKPRCEQSMPTGKRESHYVKQKDDRKKGMNRKKETYFCSSGLMKWWESWQWCLRYVCICPGANHNFATWPQADNSTATVTASTWAVADPPDLRSEVCMPQEGGWEDEGMETICIFSHHISSSKEVWKGN